MKTVFASDTAIEASFSGGWFRNEFRLKHDPWIAQPSGPQRQDQRYTHRLAHRRDPRI